MNWVWQQAQEYLASDLEDRFKTLVELAAMANPGVAQQELSEYMQGRSTHHGAPGLKVSAAVPNLYPGPDMSATPREPFGRYTAPQMKARIEKILEAAMKCYRELADLLAIRFGRTLALRGMMPVTFYGVVFHDPDRDRGAFDWSHGEPGLDWLLKPANVHSTHGNSERHNTVDLTLNDQHCSDEIHDERDVLYEAFRSYVDSDPSYEPFARTFSTTSGRINALQARPATRLAMSWLAEDLVQLGFLPDNFRIVSW
ncbi:hypothetical protein [Rhodococcus sp. SORGH_AS_0301]|uniref:hypothetical protein n=1 Tax=Rhodococcus sp. SORGH_AS_0301 TaxID=3041780 RepID=UPI00278A06DD|nr:hypothetical protein [Rhodococcus sp. SORGH_AS_0301]MDQ1178552.1 hypothetical protein [Rhodococcus sp. SORGH_AS_0301]